VYPLNLNPENKSIYGSVLIYAFPISIKGGDTEFECKKRVGFSVDSYLNGNYLYFKSRQDLLILCCWIGCCFIELGFIHYSTLKINGCSAYHISRHANQLPMTNDHTTNVDWYETHNPSSTIGFGLFATMQYADRPPGFVIKMADRSSPGSVGICLTGDQQWPKWSQQKTMN